MTSFQGKNIWLIGASSGIGRALAIELAGRGATLLLSARTEQALNQLNVELKGRHHVFPLDVTNAASVQETAVKIQQCCPQLDSVIFMAAIYHPMSLGSMDVDVVSKLIDVNLKGAFNTVHSTLPVFSEQGRGQLVLCASVSGYRGLPNGQPYSSTKAAMINLAESLRAEKAKENIDIKVINPGFVKTPMTSKNEFKMPMMIESDAAARVIATQLQSNRFEIHFPKRFTYLMKLIKCLPDKLYFFLVGKIEN